MPTFKDPSDAEDALTRLLLTASPVNPNGNKTITYLAKCMKLTKAAVYKWVKQKKLPPERAMQIVEISGIDYFDKKGKPVMVLDADGAIVRRVSLRELDPFVYKAS